MRNLTYMVSLLLVLGSCNEITSNTVASDLKCDQKKKEVIRSQELKVRLVEFKSEITSLYVDSILIDLIIDDDSTLTLISDVAIQEKNYLGYFHFEDNIPILIYSKDNLGFLDSLFNISNLKKGYPDGYNKYNSDALLPPFEPYLNTFKLAKSLKLELLEKGFK